MKNFEITFTYFAETLDKVKDYLNILGIKATIKEKKETRTQRQNKSLHLWFSLLAETLNDAGFYIKSVINDSLQIPWTETHIKELLWRPVQKEMLGKDSTTKLTTKEIDLVYDVINKSLGERCSVFVPFPSREWMYD